MTENALRHYIQSLVDVRASIAALEEEESTYVEKIIEGLKHDQIGQKTYDGHAFKVTVKTSLNTTLDKALLNQVWDIGLPINRAYSYTLRENDFNAAMTHGSPELRKLLADIVTQKPAKPSVKVEVK